MSTYVVFAVDGADRLTLLCPPNAENPHELKQVALSFVQAPKLAKRLASGELGQDDPCAFDAMELVRAQCLGKQVRFEDDYMIEPIKRMSGRLTLPSGKDAGLMLLESGFARTPDRIPPQMPKDIHDAYVKAMSEARAQKKGIFAANAQSTVRKMTVMDATTAEDTLAKLQANPNGEKVRVERVLSGSSLILYIPSLGLQASFALAGIIAPLAKDGITAAEAAVEAKFHVERFLLHRNVVVQFTGVDAFFNLLGSVTSPKGCFQQELVSKGFAMVHGGTLGFAAAFADALRAAEQDAQSKRLGMWKQFSEGKLEVNAGNPGGHSGTAIPVGGAGATLGAEMVIEGDREFVGLVVQVMTSDTIVVKNLASGKLVKASLSGLRASKNVQREHDGKSPETRVTYHDYAWESKELLRTQFVGKKVSVFVDYVRTIQETKEVRPMITAVEEVSRVNLAAAVLEHGFGTFFLGRSDTCSQAVQLQNAELAAMQRAVGLHSGKEAPVTKVVELSRLGDAKGKYYLAFLHRGMQQGRPPVWRGIVDVVLGGGSFRVYIPKEHFQIPFKVAGIIAPSSALNPGETADPFAAESKEFAMLQLQQREVDLQVDTSDRAGNFIGNIALVGAQKTFAVQIVEAGLATVANADRLPYGHQLHEAEKAAKAAGVNIWSAAGGVPQRQVKMDAAFAAAAPDAIRPASDASWMPVTLADAIDSNSVFLQSNTPAAKETRAAIQGALQLAAAGSGYTPAKNECVCALFRDDGTWNRAKVLNVYKDEGYVEVNFIDFGTKIEIKLKDIRAYPKEGGSILRDAPPQAFAAKLAFLKGRGADSEYAGAANDAIFEYAEAGTLFATCAYESSKAKYYIVSTATTATATTLNETLLSAGVTTIDKTAAKMDANWFKKMDKAQDAARREHLRLWKFGDADDDSDDD